MTSRGSPARSGCPGARRRAAAADRPTADRRGPPRTTRFYVLDTCVVRPVLVFDGDCAFCARCVRLIDRLNPVADIVAWQAADLPRLGLTADQCMDAVQWVDDRGVRTGHAAVASILLCSGRPWRSVGRTISAPGISVVARFVYRLVAANRHRLLGGTAACAVNGHEASRVIERSRGLRPVDDHHRPSRLLRPDLRPVLAAGLPVQ